MMRPLRGARRYCSLVVLLWVVIARCLRGGVGVAGVSYAIVVGVNLLRVSDGGAVIPGIGDTITITGHLDGEGESVTGARAISNTKMGPICAHHWPAPRRRFHCHVSLLCESVPKGHKQHRRGMSASIRNPRRNQELQPRLRLPHLAAWSRLRDSAGIPPASPEHPGINPSIRLTASTVHLSHGWHRPT